RRGPRMNRPCMSRATRWWYSSATARRCAVGRARPVDCTSCARVAGPASRAPNTIAALSRTPTPLPFSSGVLSMLRYCRPIGGGARAAPRPRADDGGALAPRAPPSSRHASPQRAQGRIVMAGTLAEKVWADHVVRRGENGEPDLLYIDLQLLHEVTSPQAFDGLRQEGRT